MPTTNAKKGREHIIIYVQSRAGAEEEARLHEHLKKRRAKERNCTDAQPCLYVEVRSRTAHRTFAVSTDQGVTPARRVRGGVLWQLAGVRSTREAEARLFAVTTALRLRGRCCSSTHVNAPNDSPSQRLVKYCMSNCLSLSVTCFHLDCGLGSHKA